MFGDTDNLLGLTVLEGSVDATFTQTVTTTPRFDDTLTLKLYADATPDPGPGLMPGVGWGACGGGRCGVNRPPPVVTRGA